MAKGRGSKSTKLQKAAAAGATSVASATTPIKSTARAPSSSQYPKISDDLRQAVKDLGGDEEDLHLIEGIDEDDEEPAVKTDKPPVNEKKLKKELGDFMKGLDFSTFKDAADVEVGEVESGSSEEVDSEEEEDDDEEESEEEEKVDEEHAEEDKEEDEEEEADDEPAEMETPKVAVAELEQAKPTGPVDLDSTSGTNVPAAPSWPSLAPPLPPLTSTPPPPSGHHLNELRQRANRLLETLPPLARAGSSSDAAFINQILTSGTYQDKLSALVLLVRESPIHAVKELNRLRTMAGWKEDGIGGGGNKDQRVAVMKALADWWVSGGGKEQGKLRYFADQPLLAHPQITDRHLLVFAFEDYLKKWFFNLLQVLETLTHDTLPFVRTQSLHLVFRLLSGNAEQEQNLLRLGVNKLGDIDRPVASKASHHILQLLQAHPAMKAVVAREVSALVLKPSSTSATAQAPSSSHVRFDDDKGKKSAAVPPKPETTGHARYYGLITLNQITLTRKDQEVAGKMVDLYFEVFREILGNSMNEKDDGPAEDVEEVDQDKIEKVAGKVDKWRGRRKGTRTKNGKKSALEEEELVETGEAKLVAAILTGINRALPFAKLDETMFDTYMDTLFKITHAGTFNTSIQALNLIFQVSTTASESRQAVSDRFYRTMYDSLFDGRLVTSSKQAMYLNLLFKAMKADDKISRVMAFVKRLLQMLGMHQPSFICGALFLLGELFSMTPGLKRMLIEPEDDGEEHFVDADDEKEKQADDAAAKKALAGKEYDGRKREPLYANADTSCLWELIPFLNHFHPSVSLQANQLLLSQPLTGSSDISLNTLVSFLDRFVYRNPKKTLQPKGASIMQPAAASDKSGMVVKNHGVQGGTQGVMVNSEQFWRKKIEDVPVEMMFFHKYFSEKLQRKETAKGKGKKRDDDDDDDLDLDASDDDEAGAEDEDDEEAEGSDEEEQEGSEGGEEEEDSDPEEAEIWKAMKASMPGAGDDMGLSADDDESDDMSDYDDAEEDDDEEPVGSEDEDEEEYETEQPKRNKGKRASRSPSIASSQSSFPDFADEEDDIISDSDMEMPDIVLDGATDSDVAEEEEEDPVKAGKRKRNDERKERRKKRKELPTFGSYEDYQKLIEEGGSEED